MKKNVLFVQVVQNMLSFDPVPGYTDSAGQGPKVDIELTPMDKRLEPYRIGTLEDRLSSIRDPVLGESCEDRLSGIRFTCSITTFKPV